MAVIHPSAIVETGAELADSVRIGPYAVIGAHVRIGEGTSIGAHCVIEGHTTIGCDNHVFQFASLGGAPQDKKYAGEPTQLIIGDRNTIREFCTFNTGTVQDGGVTSMGDDNWVMAYAHLAHDCKVGNRTIFANNAQIAGHVQVGDWAILGGFTAVHQFVHIGAHSMTGLGTILTQDLPPFVMAGGNPAKAFGFNLEGLKRRGFSAPRLAAIKAMHRALYRKSLTLDDAQAEIVAARAEHTEADVDIALMLDFLAGATRGIVR
jgi:UDP-N-acetylglucosamine acyltransferase